MSHFTEMVAAAAAADHGPGTRGLVTGEPDAPSCRSWWQVRERALRMSAALRSAAEFPPVRRGDAVAVLAARPDSVVPAVQAVWLAGASVTMLHQPTPRTDLEVWAADTLRVTRMIDARLVLLGEPFREFASVLAQQGIRFRELDELSRADTAPTEEVPTGEDDLALLQLTSGSSAEPKAVRITHGNLHHNTRAITAAARLSPEHDVAVSWLPLFHDMGMVGCLAVPMALGMRLVKVTPADFLAWPSLWPDLIGRYGGTVTAAPNFAYAIAARGMERAERGEFDLSTLRFALNGAEPVDPDTVERFLAAGAGFGLRPESVVCAFGMAEATLAVSFAPANSGMSVDTVDSEELRSHRRAVPTDAGTSGARGFVKLGPPLPGMEVVVVDESGSPLPERSVGSLLIRGAAVTPGYLTVHGPVAATDEDGWLDTGDEGYLVDGQLVVCGRRKEVIVLGGRNVHPADIERAACAVPGVRAGNAAAVRREADTRREHFAVIVESRSAGDETEERRLRKEVAAKIFGEVGARPSTVLVVAPGSLPKTPSGKIRRGAGAELLS
ncbi:fatty-acyl-CoA synthase [Actinopolyspora alba]|uniref:Fatty-acyl-CoA synthase n=1 Tax=Actinopolyspora alba TaxID=673379 RepID=A0A1I1TTW7_9ACTN|nr:fatty acyl-AMP ligase [Actinopolyspora alba]SFD62081.1 fatty-acyl-CoA synthase [Actinopolyspora alba]